MHARLSISGVGVVIAKNIVALIGSTTYDVDVVSHGRFIDLDIRITITVSFAINFSIVMIITVNVAVCVATVASIYVRVTVANAVAITNAVPSIDTGAFVGTVTDDVVGAGTVSTMFSRSREMMNMISIVCISGGNYFDDCCLQSVACLVCCVDANLIIIVMFFANLRERILKSDIAA